MLDVRPTMQLPDDPPISIEGRDGRGPTPARHCRAGVAGFCDPVPHRIMRSSTRFATATANRLADRATTSRVGPPLEGRDRRARLSRRYGNRKGQQRSHIVGLDQPAPSIPCYEKVIPSILPGVVAWRSIAARTTCSACS